MVHKYIWRPFPVVIHTWFYSRTLKVLFTFAFHITFERSVLCLQRRSSGKINPSKNGESRCVCVYYIYCWCHMINFSVECTCITGYVYKMFPLTQWLANFLSPSLPSPLPSSSSKVATVKEGRRLIRLLKEVKVHLLLEGLAIPQLSRRTHS